ncbi:MAG TPA: pseudouridine synthase, partial [Methylotenera sp.]|nr:pseudouridine synthase [Methylotenera sp.]
MTTLKISKKPGDASTVVVKKSPVRRNNSLPRDRTVAPVKPQRAEAQQPREQRAPDSRPAAQRQEPQRQRNHRHDGGLREQPSANATQQPAPDSRAPAPRAMRVDARRNENTSRDKADREGAYRNPPRRGGKARDGFVASEFDKTRSNKEAFATRANASQPEQPRLSKVMAERGLCSR